MTTGQASSPTNEHREAPMSDDPPERIYEPADRLRRRIYRMTFRNQILLFIGVGVAFGVLGFIYVLIMYR